MQDIIVYISLDTASKEKETLLPLILSFEGAFAYKEYNKAEDVAKDFTTASSPTLAAAQKLFDQIKVENCPGRTKKVRPGVRFYSEGRHRRAGHPARDQRRLVLPDPCRSY